MNKSYKVTILTPSLNQGKYLEENILSVLNQSYDNIEHIVIDGGSRDNTVQILKKYSHLKWISENDNGQSDAYNKGLKIASGELILCLNSDDYLLTNDVIRDAVNAINKVDWDKFSAFMGNVIVIDSAGTRIGEMNNKSREYSHDDLLNKLPVVIHPATLFKSSCLTRVGGFAENMHYVMDYDIFLKITKITPICSIPVYISSLRRHSDSKGCSENNWKFSWEFLKLRFIYGGNFFSKVSLQPLKDLLYHVLGSRVVNFAKRNPLISLIGKKVGITKLNSLTWYDEETKKQI